MRYRLGFSSTFTILFIFPFYAYSLFSLPAFFLPPSPNVGRCVVMYYRGRYQTLFFSFLTPNSSQANCLAALFYTVSFISHFPLHWGCSLSKSRLIWRSPLRLPYPRLSLPTSVCLLMEKQRPCMEASPRAPVHPRMHLLLFSPLRRPYFHASSAMYLKKNFFNYLVFNLCPSRGLFRASPLPTLLETEIATPFFNIFITVQTQGVRGLWVSFSIHAKWMQKITKQVKNTILF